MSASSCGLWKRKKGPRWRPELRASAIRPEARLAWLPRILPPFAPGSGFADSLTKQVACGKLHMGRERGRWTSIQRVERRGLG